MNGCVICKGIITSQNVIYDFQISMNVKEDLTTVQRMSLLLQNVSIWWEDSGAPVLTTWATDWTSPTMLAVKVRPCYAPLLLWSV